MMLVFRREALEDLDSISVYVERMADRSVADGYDRRIRAKIATLVDFPNRGTDRPEFGDGVRSINFEGRYLILYRVADDRVLVTRVVAGAQDLSDLTP
ncbi:hypothetical protein ASE86_05155 [Sphingomonas sp. Leaf33]|uniref:type II toxin-antitoxin system RelE/ParE family toxin n=1 Tax=Sphingomonas sp. Leaf33 TaxID=1736215 RepID=UPI0006FA17C6|nr:type II toxin-antitoxin system RelE/ParE family toxin [Sphingomonas sp. Leaf33]KQN25604.1 hypothetical protein ASE86_05155 [Sphingomonas sp. Leaf33]